MSLPQFARSAADQQHVNETTADSAALTTPLARPATHELEGELLASSGLLTQCQERDFGRAVEAQRHVNGSDAATRIKLHPANIAQPSWVPPRHSR